MSTGDDATLVLSSLKRVTDGKAMVFSLSRLRNEELEGYFDKKYFDALVLQLQEDGWVNLYHHDHPFGVSAEMREGFVFDGKTYYNAISVKNRSMRGRYTP